jgi:hypothetical protein
MAVKGRIMRLAGFRTFLSILLLLILACAPTQPPLPPVIYPKAVYPILQYPFSTSREGLEIAAIPFAPGQDVFADPRDTTDGQAGTFLNVLDAGIQPIRLIIWNDTQDNLTIFTDQIFGISQSVVYFTYSPNDAVDLVVNSPVFQEALKGSRVGPMVRSLLGGRVFLDAARSGVTGLAMGGVAGGTARATGGAMAALMEPAYEYEKHLTRLISKEYSEMALKDCTLYPGHLLHGLIFLPSHSQVKTLRIVAFNNSAQRSELLEIDFGEGLP